MRSPHFLLVLRRPTRPLQRRWFGRCSNGPGRRFEGLDSSDLEKQKNKFGGDIISQSNLRSKVCWLQFFVLESWLLDGWMVSWWMGSYASYAFAGLLFLKKDQNCKCRNRQLTSTRFVDSLMPEQAQGKTSWDAGLMPKTMISPMTYKLTKWTNELPQYDSELTSVPLLPIIQGCPNGVDTLTPQLPWALQRTSGRQKIPWKSRPQILNSFWKSVKFIL